jgi:hypothetical protein
MNFHCNDQTQVTTRGILNPEVRTAVLKGAMLEQSLDQTTVTVLLVNHS